MEHIISHDQPQLEAFDLYQSYSLDQKPIEVLQGITLSIQRKETLFLRGASGSGKSTLLYILAGLEKPKSGSIYFEREQLRSFSSSQLALMRNKKMGFVFQSYFLLPELSAFENIHLPALFAGAPNSDRVNQLLQKIGLSHRADHLPSQLSGGEQQRVAIARALMNQPTILFADEPTGNLDPSTGRVIADLLLSFAQEEELTLVIVTHDPEFAARGDRQLVLEKGKILV